MHPRKRSGILLLGTAGGMLSLIRAQCAPPRGINNRFPSVLDRASFILWRGKLSSASWKMVMAFAREVILDWKVPNAPEN